MKKNILALGTSLNKKEQQSISGGARPRCFSHRDCFLITGDRTDRCINNYCFFY
ncbi:hypothetical protein [Tenacibaculum skagerrakense]|uniref:hypothetical protein n=1 Tax=Tenacibaculum skagerrakense TaxID=186571 RepID=UPI0014046EC3|nr:hypothetical protein [Tenacibaculum skagerrakense]